MLALERSRYAAVISVSMAFVFPVALLFAMQGLGLTGIWLNFPLTSLLGAMLSVFVLSRERHTIMMKDHPESIDQ